MICDCAAVPTMSHQEISLAARRASDGTRTDPAGTGGRPGHRVTRPGRRAPARTAPAPAAGPVR